MTTPKFLRSLFLNELGLLPTQNIRSIMKVLMIDTKEECYEIMKIIYEETQKPNRSALQLKPVNRFDNLPLDLKRLIKSYLPPNKIIQGINDSFMTLTKYDVNPETQKREPHTYLERRNFEHKQRNKRLEEKRQYRYCYFIKDYPIDYIIKNIKLLEAQKKISDEEAHTKSATTKYGSYASHQELQDKLNERFKPVVWKPSGNCLINW